MKLLLDENIPEKLRQDFPGHEVKTAREMGWKGKKNGELLKLMLQKKFDALITADKNLSHQQNFKSYPLPVIVLSAIRINYPRLKELAPHVQKLLKKKLKPGPVEVK